MFIFLVFLILAIHLFLVFTRSWEKLAIVFPVTFLAVFIIEIFIPSVKLPWEMITFFLFPLIIFFIIFAFSEINVEREWEVPNPNPVQFLGPKMAVAPKVLGHSVPDGYRLACLYFGTGLLDRTKTLDHGFPYDILDPIPEPQTFNTSMTTLVERRAAELVRLSREQNLPVRLLWSGGIDSTAACIALLQQLRDKPEQLEIYYSPGSRWEYWNFYWQIVRKHPNIKKISHVGEALQSPAVFVTGEHGDQLFGSMKAIGLPPEQLHADWREVFPEILSSQFATPQRAQAMFEYLLPQIEKAPIPINSVFELLWWLNFSMKWQAVSLRIPASLDQGIYQTILPMTHHFYRTSDFELWAMANMDKKIKGTDWTTYKWPLKDYILEHTGHERYHRTKEKKPSLKGVAKTRRYGQVLAIDNTQTFCFQAFDDDLRTNRNIGTAAGVGAGVGAGITYSYSFSQTTSFTEKTEVGMWADLDDGE